MQKSQTCKSQAEFELRETVEEFEKDIMAIVKSSVPEPVTWQELLEETHSDTELLDLKEVIAGERILHGAWGKKTIRAAV